jgi:hypothetical protein
MAKPQKPQPPPPPPQQDIGELCSGCGAVAPKHPMAGVARDEETGLMTEFPICHACWVDPSHRQRVLKMHFFDRASAAVAVDAAERNILVEPPS